MLAVIVLLSTSAVVASEVVSAGAPHESCHASTIARTPGGLVVAWFGGTAEGEADVGIWLSRQEQGEWSQPREVARDDTHPCWNPVLFPAERGVLQLYYKVGPSPREWWGMVMESADEGRTWSPPRRLPRGILGPIKNKPVSLGGGVVLSGSSTENAGWRVHMERSEDGGRTWSRGEALNDGHRLEAIQPTVLPHPGGTVQILCRSRQGRIAVGWSADRGRTWSPLSLTEVPNPNSGIDAVVLEDGRSLLVYNHTTEGRSKLNVATSAEGRTWTRVLDLEDQPGEYSYPAVIQTPDGLVHATYTYRRESIKHVVLDPSELEGTAP
jgi:predicted neuraminidase